MDSYYENVGWIEISSTNYSVLTIHIDEGTYTITHANNVPGNGVYNC